VTSPRVLLALVLWLGPTGAAAESSVWLPLPDAFEAVQADTYDEVSGERVGNAELSMQRTPEGLVRMSARTGIDGAARTELSALLEPNEAGDALRLLTQRSESHDESGISLGVLSIDHRKGTARCGVPAGTEKAAKTVELPADDRVVNVPLNLLFHELVLGETDEVSFQVLLCRFGARIVNAKAKVAGGDAAAGAGLIEVQYNMDFGMLSSVVAPFMPRLSFWFDKDSTSPWVGHRMPLFSKGPNVLVVRTGFTPAILGAIPTDAGS
jgi:hypothetical protein